MAGIYGRRRTSEEIMADAIAALDKDKRSNVAACREVLNLDPTMTIGDLVRALHAELHEWDKAFEVEGTDNRVLRAINAAAQLVPLCR